LTKIKPYFMRIAYYTRCSEESLITSLIYIDRLIDHCKLTVTPHNVHKLILTSVLVAVKFCDDDHHKNAYFGKVGCVSNKEMKSLERIFLFKIKFDLCVTNNVYNFYRRGLDQAILKERDRISNSSLNLPKKGLHVQEFDNNQATDNLTVNMKKAQIPPCTKPFSFLNAVTHKMWNAPGNKNYYEICSGCYIEYVPVQCCG